MKIKLKVIVGFIILLLSGIANAKVEEETLCFKISGNERIRLAFKYYLDVGLNQQLGALAQYDPSKQPLSLVFSDDGTSDDSLDWELRWLEVIGGKITGTYALLKPRSATINGAYMKYKNFRTGKETVFEPSGGLNGECAIGSKK